MYMSDEIIIIILLLEDSGINRGDLFNFFVPINERKCHFSNSFILYLNLQIE